VANFLKQVLSSRGGSPGEATEARPQSAFLSIRLNFIFVTLNTTTYFLHSKNLFELSIYRRRGRGRFFFYVADWVMRLSSSSPLSTQTRAIFCWHGTGPSHSHIAKTRGNIEADPEPFSDAPWAGRMWSLVDRAGAWGPVAGEGEMILRFREKGNIVWGEPCWLLSLTMGWAPTSLAADASYTSEPWLGTASREFF
jgi:hypothetical protein